MIDAQYTCMTCICLQCMMKLDITSCIWIAKYLSWSAVNMHVLYPCITAGASEGIFGVFHAAVAERRWHGGIAGRGLRFAGLAGLACRQRQLTDLRAQCGSDDLAPTMHSTHTCLRKRAFITLHYIRNEDCVNMACDILAQVWKTKHDEYYASIGFAKSVNALADALHLHKGRSGLKSAANAVRVLLLGLSVGCPEIQKSVKHMLQTSGLIKPTKHQKK